MNVKDNHNNTPLHEAIVHGNEEVVLLLLNFKPYPSVKNMFAGIIFIVHRFFKVKKFIEFYILS